MKKSQATVLFLIFFTSINLKAFNPPQIKAVVQPEKTTVGEMIKYTITLAGQNLNQIGIELPSEREVFLQKKEDKKGKDEEENEDIYKVPLYIIHNIKKEDNSDQNLDYLSITVEISFYHPGKFFLPEIGFVGPDQIKIGYKIPEVMVQGLNQTGQFEEIEPPISLKGNYYRIIFLILGISLLTLVVIFLIKYLKKRKAEQEKIPVVIPPIKIFLKEIKKLNGEKLIRSNQIEKFVVGLSTIFRRFLSNLLDFDGTEMTTEEISQILEKKLPQKNYKENYSEIIRSLQLWDLAKFAEFTPSSDVLLDNLEKTIRLAKFLSMDIKHD